MVNHRFDYSFYDDPMPPNWQFDVAFARYGREVAYCRTLAAARATVGFFDDVEQFDRRCLFAKTSLSHPTHWPFHGKPQGDNIDGSHSYMPESWRRW